MIWRNSDESKIRMIRSLAHRIFQPRCPVMRSRRAILGCEWCTHPTIWVSWESCFGGVAIGLAVLTPSLFDLRFERCKRDFCEALHDYRVSSWASMCVMITVAISVPSMVHHFQRCRPQSVSVSRKNSDGTRRDRGSSTPRMVIYWLLTTPLSCNKSCKLNYLRASMLTRNNQSYN